MIDTFDREIHEMLILETRQNQKSQFSRPSICQKPQDRCDSAVTARVRSASKKFREYLPILTGKGFSLKLKGKVYATCVRSCLMHGSETWPMKVEHKLKLNRTEMRMMDVWGLS